LTVLGGATAAWPLAAGAVGFAFSVRRSWRKTMAREELKWQNIDADDSPAEVKKSFDAMVEPKGRIQGRFGKAA
jgi:hypothetical protein